VFVDDLHADFRNTGRLRNLLKSIATELIQEGDWCGMRSSGPSHASVDITSDCHRLASAIKKVIGNALTARDILRSVDGGEIARRVLSQDRNALNAARQSLESLIAYDAGGSPLPKALIYISNGYYFDAMPPSAAELSHLRSELAGAAARAGVRIVVVDPRVAAPHAGNLDLDNLDLDPDVSRRYWTVTQESLRPLWQETDGFALLQHEDLFSGLTRVSTVLRR
jgi:hypothetical protein